MFYEEFTAERFFTETTTEAEARSLIWRSRFQGKEFVCPHCRSEQFYALGSRPEVRTCTTCRRQIRLRAGTLFESSKTPLLLWVKALFYVMQGNVGPGTTASFGIKALWVRLGYVAEDPHGPSTTR